MRRLAFLLALIAALLFVGCCTGVDPSSAPPAAMAPGTYLVSTPGTEFGFTRAAKSAIMVPPDVIACATDTAAKVLGNLSDGLRCAVNAAFPEKVPVAVVAPAARAVDPCAPRCVPSAPHPFVPPPPPPPSGPVGDEPPDSIPANRKGR